MILPRPGTWHTHLGKWILWERLYDSKKNNTSTIWCKVSLGYLKTQQQLSHERNVQNHREALRAILTKKEK